MLVIHLENGATDPRREYPSYEVITANGLSKAIEHRAMEPVFYISDDPTVLAQLWFTGSNSWEPHE